LAADVSPVEKVVTMLEDLQTQVITEGKAEAKTYDKFACFCKDMTNEKTDSITSLEDSVTELTASIESDTTTRSELDDDINELNKQIDDIDKSMTVAKETRASQKATFDALDAELNKGTTDLTNAVNMLKSKQSATMSMIDLKSSIKTVRQAAFMADAMGHSPAHRQALTALLQSADPEVPMEDFTFHSDEIVKTIEGLLGDFKAKHSEVKIEETKKTSEFDSLMQAKTMEKDAAAKELAEDNKQKASKMEALAAASRDLTAAQAQLTDDQTYLKDLTEKCNLKSKEWDQRSQMRQDELTALTTALTIVKGKVAGSTSDKTVRFVQSAVRVTPAAHNHQSQEVDASEADDTQAFLQEEGVSFVQLSSPREKLSLVAKQTSKFLQSDSPRDRVVALLRARSEQLESPVLAALASKVQADPFVKIKKLIQELIERLLQEAADEANHKGWCDKEFGKAKQQRGNKAEAVKVLNENLAKNEAQRDKLSEEIAVLTKEIGELTDSLATTTKERNDESAENSATVSEAEEGKAAVEQAIDVLDKFYKTAAKAANPTLIQGVDDEIPDAGFGGAYKGGQSASTGILGMLDVIKSDFERTVKETEKDEKAAAKEFMEFETTTKASIGSKTVAKENKEAELAETNSEIDDDNTSLDEEQTLLDKSVQEIIELQPACVETGMSYEDRVAKREQEIESLKEALCTLDNEGPHQTEPECS